MTSQKGINTTSLAVECSFMASADDMFSILTDEKRIPQWSRNAAVVGLPAFSSLFLIPPSSRILVRVPLIRCSVVVSRAYTLLSHLRVSLYSRGHCNILGGLLVRD
jgi:hypothetical protein